MPALHALNFLAVESCTYLPGQVGKGQPQGFCLGFDVELDFRGATLVGIADVKNPFVLAYTVLQILGGPPHLFDIGAHELQ